MKDEAVARTAANLGVPVHMLEQLHDDSWPRCHSKADTVLSSAARADVTCPKCLVGLPPRLGCGRVDVHDGHPWRRPLVLRDFRLLPPRWYDCPGTPVIEGGAR